MANHVNFARRMRLPALYFQLGDHIPTSATMASYQTSFLSLGVQPPTNGREPDDFQSRAQIKRLFEESELVSGDSEAFRKFSDNFPEKLVAEYVEHLPQIKMGKEKKKEKTERERMEPLIREYSDIDWVGLYNSDKLSSLRVDELLLYFSHHKIILKGKKAATIKAHIGSLLYDSMECQQPRQPLLRNMQKEVTSSLSGVETDSQ